MVNKNALEKLSDQELEKFIQDNTRKVPEAIQFAYNILLDRGKIFQAEEQHRIEQLIESRVKSDRELNLQKLRDLDKRITDDEDAIELYSNFSILLISILFGLIFGAIIAMVNYFMLRKYVIGILLVVAVVSGLGISYYFIEQIIPEAAVLGSMQSVLVYIILSIIGGILIIQFNNLIYPRYLEYRSKPIVIPVFLIIICIILRFAIGYFVFDEKF